MDTKRVAIGTVVGGITMFLVGYLIWDILFDYYAALLDAAGIAREPQLFWVIAASNVPFAALVTLAIERGGSSTIGRGVKVGAVHRANSTPDPSRPRPCADSTYADSSSKRGENIREILRVVLGGCWMSQTP